MKKTIKTTLVIIILLILKTTGNAESVPRVIIFSPTKTNDAAGAAAVKTTIMLNEEFNKLGRFLPIEQNDADRLIGYLSEKDRAAMDYRKISESLGADIYVIVDVYQAGTVFVGEMKIDSLDPKYNDLEKGYRVKTEFVNNIPLLICREISIMHEKLGISAQVIKKDGDSYVVGAGEWNGLVEEKTYGLSDGSNIKITRCGRYDSYAVLNRNYLPGETIEIEKFPESVRLTKELDEKIEEEVIKNRGIDYTLMQGLNPYERTAESLLVVNLFGNILLPGYGASLSTGYLGFENPKPDYYSMAACAGIYMYQIMYVPVSTDFKANFFPFIQDSDKSDRLYRYHKFLWCTIPFTFSACFLDQLAVQFNSSRTLPPFFQDRNTGAAVLSAIIPGGGHFYKGYRLSGWGFFGSEMVLLGYGTYNYGTQRGRNALYAFGAVKILDIVSAFFMKPSYKFFNKEIDRTETTEIFVSSAGDRNSPVLNVGVAYKY